MLSTMRLEGHTALVHTAAASNLGQMLNRLCLADGVQLVNIVRSAEQERVLKALGAERIVNSTAPDFREQLIAAVKTTGATLAFDAVGGGPLAGKRPSLQMLRRSISTAHAPISRSMPTGA
jgi:hypothetical protein